MFKIFLLLFNIYAQYPELYTKKAYTTEKVEALEDKYYFTYSFKDDFGNLRELKWSFSKWQIDRYLDSFGLYEQKGDKVLATDSEYRNGRMLVRNGKVSFDYERIIEESRELVEPLYHQLKKIKNKYKLSEREFVILIMRFLQDIPYGVPPSNYNNRFIMGLFPPSELLKSTWGDCDSKSLLMATLLSLDNKYNDKLAIIQVPGHALLGIQMVASPYDKTIKHKFKKYIYVEPVGAKRTSFGQTNSPYSTSINVVPLQLRFYQSSKAEAIESKSPSIKEKAFKCPDNALEIKYVTPFDKKTIKSCQLKVDGVFKKHGPTQVYDKNGILLEESLYKLGDKI